MFCSRTLSHVINRLHKNALIITYVDYSSDFKRPLTEDITVTIHIRNLRTLAMNMYNILNILSPLS